MKQESITEEEQLNAQIQYIYFQERVNQITMFFQVQLLKNQPNNNFI